MSDGMWIAIAALIIGVFLDNGLSNIARALAKKKDPANAQG